MCKTKLSICFINQALCHEDIWDSGGIAPPFMTSALDRVSGQLHALAALPMGKEPVVPTDCRLGGPRSWSGRYGEEKILAPAKNWTPTIQPITILTELSWLLTWKLYRQNKPYQARSNIFIIMNKSHYPTETTVKWSHNTKHCMTGLLELT
jgi:hypothetical protein